jgi:hypothetical protein
MLQSESLADVYGVLRVEVVVDELPSKLIQIFILSCT